MAYYIYSWGVSNGVTLNYDSMYIYSGGTANSTTVNNYGSMYISRGGVANSTTVNSGGYMYISSGGSAIEVKENGGYVFVANGANVTFAFNTITGFVLSGGHMTVHKNTVANSTTVNSDGDMYIHGGVANNTTINSSGTMYISSGGVANSTTVNSGGGMGIYRGGVANSTTMSGGGMVINSGVANSTTVNSDGSMYIYSGGVANSTTVSDGGLTVFSGGVANSTTVNHGGSMYISSGGSAIEVKENGGYVVVGDGANVTFASNTISGLSINNGCGMTVHKNTVANNTTVSYGDMYIHGGVANSTTVNATCAMRIVRGGVANSTTVNEFGYMFISSGGVANSTTMSGAMYLSSGGVANSTTVSVGRMSISSGGVANSTTLISGGDMIISSGGVANSTTVNEFGYMFISSGGVANSTTVNFWGVVYISSGGVANSTTVNRYGYMYIDGGGVHRGSLQIDSGSVISAYIGAVVDFTVADRTAADGYLINDLSLISGAPSYTITVSATQAFGTYKLAQGAENFTGSITIGDGTVDYGMITVNGDDFVRNGVIYSLDKVDGDLTFTVAKQPVASNLQGNVNGVYWSGSSDAYTVIYSKDNFATSLQVNTTTNSVDTYGMPAGSYQWKVAAEGEEYKGNNIVSDNTTAAQKLISDADGNMDLFFARSSGTWNSEYFAQRSGTQKLVALNGKNRIQDVFMGSTDANVLVLTDDANGDALFIDDMYSAFGTQARLSQIDEIRAGAGNDIVDLTSDKYAFAGDKLTVFGGAGDDTIWANSGNDIIIGGSGNDSLFGGGGNDTFIFGDNWGKDTVEQLSGGSVTLHFENGSLANWNAATGVYSDGVNSVTVTGTSDITLKFGADASLPAGVFTDAANEKIFEDKNKGMIA